MQYVRRLVDVVGGKQSRKMNVVLAGDTMPLSAAENLWNELVRANGCIKCDMKPKGFIEGPTGSICVNVFCTHCGQGYNLTPLAQWAEMIHKDTRYIVVEEP